MYAIYCMSKWMTDFDLYRVLAFTTAGAVIC